MNDRRLNLVRSLLALPTAPYRQQAVQAFIDAFCEERGLYVKIDPRGSRIVTHGRARGGRALAFAAHMDHPGFLVAADSRAGKAAARFYGGVEEKYFPNARVAVFTETGKVRATVIDVKTDKTKRFKHCRLHVEKPVQRGDLGMWDLPAVQIRGGRLYSRACDDLVGCAAILCLLDELTRRRVPQHVQALFTVAEEAGLHGAKALCAAGTVAKKTVVISVETSSVLPGVSLGGGAVIRVGDRSRVFDPAVTDFLMDAARRVQAKNKNRRFQRKLMDAGTCEASVFHRFGYPTGALCIPLGNYHNRNTKTGRIAPEVVDLADLDALIDLFLAAAQNAPALDSFLTQPSPTYKAETADLGEFFLS